MVLLHNLFCQYGAEIFCRTADGLEANEQNTLYLMSQDIKESYPEWFIPQMLKLFIKVLATDKDRRTAGKILQREILKKNSAIAVEKAITEERNRNLNIKDLFK